MFKVWKKRACITLFISFLSAPTNAAIIPLDQSIFAAKIVSLENGEVIYEHNSNMLLNPASTLKTLTFYLAIKNLGENFRFSTSIFMKEHDLYIRFTGDPTLTMKDLDTLISSVSGKIKSGVNTVYLDGDIFSKELYAPGTTVEDIKFYYASPISAFSIDKNYVKFTQSHAGGLNYDNTAMFSLLKLQNKAISTADTELCPLELFNIGANEYALEGCYNSASIPSKLLVAITDPQKYARDLTLKLLKKYNIKAREVKFGKVASRAALLAEHKSEPLNVILKEMMHESDNHIADNLIRFITYNHYQKPASWFLVEKFVSGEVQKELGIDKSQFQIVDGAGLSKKNYINTDFMIRLLDRIYKNENMHKLFFECIPTAISKNSTLSNRFKESDFKAQVYAKTGTLGGVSGLTGIALYDKMGAYSFSILTNNFIGSRNSARILEESVLEEILFKVK
jgi:D-alanyl-D-alanine carboxypeptidase/D-alanyl-D-alanine-endopeptidase (penicillin-binding protein 4)